MTKKVRNETKAGKPILFSSFLDGVKDFFFPLKCDICKEPAKEVLCPRCREALRGVYAPKAFLAKGGNGFADGMVALFSFDSLPVKILLYDGKSRDYGHTDLLFGEAVERAKKLLPRADLVTFAPRRPAAKRRTGFDQGEGIARAVAHRLGIPFQDLLERKGFSVPQHRLKGDAREENVRGVFHPRTLLAGETVLLVDDIVTTGASVRECARVLKGAGAQKVFVLALAKQ